MDYSFYIIKQNTPESRLLPHAGIKRESLEINKYKGKRQRFGGYGRAPVEWRVEGIEKVEILCKTIVRILGKRSELKTIEKEAYERAIKYLEGISRFKEKVSKQKGIKKNKKQSIYSLLCSLYPSIDKKKIDDFANKTSEMNYTSVSEIVNNARNELFEIGSIDEARRIFTKIMKLDE